MWHYVLALNLKVTELAMPGTVATSVANLFPIHRWHLWHDIQCYINQEPHGPQADRHLNETVKLSAWLMTTPIRLHNKCWVLCSLARLSLSCKVSDPFLHGWPLSKELSFRLHGVTSCQIIWFFRTQSGRSSKSMIALVRLCHCISKDETIQVSCRSSSSGL